MKELVDGGGHPDGEVDPPLVLLEFVVLSSLDCAQIGFPLMRGELLRYGLRTEETNSGLLGLSLLSVCALIATQCCLGLAQLRLLALTRI